MSLFRVEETGRIRGDFRKDQMGEVALAVCRELSRADAAASIQEASRF